MQEPTQRQDGHYRSTVQVAHAVGSGVLILAAMDLANHRGLGLSDIFRLKKGEIEAHLRDCLVEGGRQWTEFGAERFDPRWAEKAEELAEAHIKVLYPQFYPATRL